MHTTNQKNYTEPKISPAAPKSCDLSKDWYVWFRFFDANTNTWKQLRYKKGINDIKNYKERIKEANALLEVIKEELAIGWNPLLKGEVNTIKIYTLRSGIDFILKLKEATLRKKSRYAYKYITLSFMEWLDSRHLGDLVIRNFTGSMAQEYMDWLLIKKKYSGRTFNDHLIVLRIFFNCFVDRDWIQKNPFRVVKRKTQTVGRNLAYTDQERDLLSDTLRQEKPRLWYFTQFVYHCFIRRTELTTIKVKHIDLLNNTIIIPGETAKNNTQESVVIPRDLVPVIREMQLHRYQSEDYVFGRSLMTCSNQYKNPNQISTVHNKIVKRLGISPEKGLYSHKHTGVCAYYYATGKDLFSVMRQLRHRDLNTTQIYLKSLGLVQNDVFRNASVA